jgi:uncharacterized protein (DUF302 family)
LNLIESTPHPARNYGVVNFASPYAFTETIERLQSAFAGHGIKVFATIDQRAEAMSVGLRMPPTTLLLFGNPKAGTPLMLAQPTSGLDLPLKALVTEPVPGRVVVSLNAAAYIIERHSLPAEFASNLVPVEQLIAVALGSEVTHV